MINKTGVDVSEFQGDINFKSLKKSVDFCIIRGGYGKNNLDGKAKQNIEGCISVGLDYAIYWFSYALSSDMAKKEADYACDLADKYMGCSFVAFDFEYDSVNYANRMGVKLSKTDVVNMAKAFLNRVKERGYIPVLYMNNDYYVKYYSEIAGMYNVWFAQWSSEKPKENCYIWQNSNNGIISGVSTLVDTDIMYEDK